jgi:outer membrane receptor for Fe3+-dicitrate
MNMIYASGLRAGDFNTDHVPAYTVFNVGLQRQVWEHGLFDKPITGRFDVVNIFDRIYEIRDGSGIGVFASHSVRAAATTSGCRRNCRFGAPEREVIP